MYPTKSAFAVEAYKDATQEPYSYLFIDFRPDQDEYLRISTSSNERVSRRNSLRLRAEMSDRVRKYLPVLKRVRRLGEKAKREYDRKCNNEFIRCVSESAKNVIKGNVPLTNRQMKNLRRKRYDLKTLSSGKPSLWAKRKVLQKGEFFSALLPPVLSLFGGLLLK